MASAYIQMIQKRISDIEKRILEDSLDMESLKNELQRLKALEFEESIKHDNEVQLLKG